MTDSERNYQSLECRFNLLEPDKINSELSRCRVHVLAIGANRNGSFIGFKAIEDAMPTMFNIPVVGHYIEENPETGEGDFGGHDRELIRTEEGVKLKDLTVPYGVVPAGANYYFENVTEPGGEVNTYLVTEAYLWTGRYSEVRRVLEKGNNQSVEIKIIDSHKADGLLHIDKFEFSAFAILGENAVPCFQSSRIIKYQAEEFKSSFAELLDEIKKCEPQDAIEFAALKAKYAALVQEHNALKLKNAADAAELCEYKSAEKLAENTELYNRFEALKGVDEYASLAGALGQYSYDELRLKLLELFAAEPLGFTANDNKLVSCGIGTEKKTESVRRNSVLEEYENTLYAQNLGG